MDKARKYAVMSSIALALVGLAWGTSYAIVKDALGTLKPFTLMMLRFGISTLLLSLIYSKKLKYITKKDLRAGLISGCFMFLSFATLVVGIKYTTASKQSFIVGAYVLIVPLMAWAVSKKRPDNYALIGAVMATAGIGLLTIDSTLSFNKGDLISVLCSLAFSAHMISLERYCRESDPVVLAIIQFAVTSVLFTVLTGLFESYDVSAATQIFWPMAYLIVITTVIAYVVQNIAQKHISSTSTALILTLETVFGSVFAVWTLGEAMSSQMVIGCLVILLGIVIQEVKPGARKATKYKEAVKLKEQEEPSAETVLLDTEESA